MLMNEPRRLNKAASYFKKRFTRRSWPEDFASTGK
jgi:hypothetical protein